MSEIKNGGLDQYGAGPFEQQQFGTAGVEGLKLATGLFFSTGYILEFRIVYTQMQINDIL